jgi:hypothetical protein
MSITACVSRAQTTADQDLQLASSTCGPARFATTPHVRTFERWRVAACRSRRATGLACRTALRLPPDLGIGRDRPVVGPPVDDRSNLLHDLGHLGVSGIEQTASRRQFGFRDWGMPRLGRPQHRFALLRKTATCRRAIRLRLPFALFHHGSRRRPAFSSHLFTSIIVRKHAPLPT